MAEKADNCLGTTLPPDVPNQEPIRSLDKLTADAGLKESEAEPKPRVENALDADVVMITALADPEGRMLRKVFIETGDATTTEVVDGVPFILFNKIFGKTNIRIAIASQTRMGMVDASILTLKAIYKFKPIYIVMTGICAGIRDSLNLGDIVIADEVFDYGSGKLVGSRLHPDYHYVSMHPSLTALFNDFRMKRDILHSIQSAWDMDSGKPKTILAAQLGPMASGAAVVASEKAVKGILSHKRKLLSVDMEAFGVAQAAFNMLEGATRFIICKGVSDYAEEGKDDSCREYSAFVSALFIKEFFRANEEYLFGAGVDE
jgi:nucleoside phosphorylase